MEGYIAEIRLFAANFAPRNWSYCNGNLISISQNTALFSLLGTTYGGNGIQTFGLPDFRSRTALGTGQGQGLSNVTLGEMSGIETETILLSEMPSHTHAGSAHVTPSSSSSSGDESNPLGFYPGNANRPIYSATQNTTMVCSNCDCHCRCIGRQSATQQHSTQPWDELHHLLVRNLPITQLISPTFMSTLLNQIFLNQISYI